MSDKYLPNIGELASSAALRDAIHIAVAPVISGENLKPGDAVGFGGANMAYRAAETHIGVVDPFMTRTVEKGERFWLFLYPNTITALRHSWEHPAFTASGVGVSTASEKWLRDFADQVDADYHEMMEVASTHCDETKNKWGGDYLCEGGKWEGQGTPAEFWEHYKNVTGESPADTTYGTPGIFSCSC